MKVYKIVTLVTVGLILSLVPHGSAAQRPAPRDLLVAAAASLSVIASELTRAAHDGTGIDVRFNFAGSNTLARQIVEGARVDVFLSADEAQMHVVEQAGRIVAGSRRDVVSNQLVLIVTAAPHSRTLQVEDLASPSVRRVAMGDPAAVPAGVYGKRWLETIRLWPAVEPKVIPLSSSPSVVSAVAAGRADVGVVYGSDAANRRGIQVAHHVSLDDAPRIVYPAAAIVGGKIAMAREFIAFLGSARAQQIFAAAGFRPLGVR